MEIKNIKTGEITTVEDVITRTYDEEMHEENLNANYDLVDVCGHQYEAGTIMRRVCYGDFRDDFNATIDFLIEEAEYDFEHLETVYMCDGNEYEKV